MTALEKIIENYNEHFETNYKKKDVFGGRRYIGIMLLRQMYIYFLWKSQKFNLTDIAKMFNYTHASVINNLKQIENRLDTQKGFKEILDKIINVDDDLDMLLKKRQRLLDELDKLQRRIDNLT